MIIHLLKILFFISIIVWLFPPIRQRRNRYFIFFLLLAISDPISILMNKLNLSYYNIQYHTLMTFFLFVSLLHKNIIQNNKFKLIIVGVIILMLGLLVSDTKLFYSVYILFYCIIFLMFLKEFITKFIFDRIIHVFSIILMLYVLTNIFKVFNLLLSYVDATGFFFVTTIFQITMGLFFSIFREDKARIVLKH